MKPKANIKHPMQPLIKDTENHIRFKKNEIVRFILDNGGIDLNKLSMMEFTNEDREHFAQLIGYSFSGFSELHYVSNESYYKAYEEYLKLSKDKNNET